MDHRREYALFFVVNGVARKVEYSRLGCMVPTPPIRSKCFVLDFYQMPVMHVSL